MPFAPTPSIDATGTVTWTNPAVPPAYWSLSSAFETGEFTNFLTYQTNVLGTVNTWDAFSDGCLGGLRLALTGLDVNDNIILNPTLSIGSLTKNQ
jgi:hypothetical protein